MKLSGFQLLVACVVSASLALSASSASAAPTAGSTAIVKLDVYPPDVNLNTKRDRQQYIVVATRADGVTLDVTREARATLADAKLARMENHTLYPTADGATTLNVDFQGHQAQIPVVVKDCTADRPISFQLDVMPVFMRSGCNTGSCHGAARGKDGFMLSLFGYDAAGDHYRITHELGFRRINLAVPEESMLLEKNDGTVPHTGGKRFDKKSEYYAVLLEWLKDGAVYDAAEVPKVVRLELYPKQGVLAGTGSTQQMIARAVYADGTDRDVSSLAVFMSSNDNSAPINADGLATAANRGEAFLMMGFIKESQEAYMTLFRNDRELADQLMATMEKWHAAQPDGDPKKAFADWLAERKQLASIGHDLSSNNTRTW